MDDMEEFYEYERRRRKIEEFKERQRPKCKWYITDGKGGYCKQRPQDPPVHGDKFYRTFCLGKKGTFCVEPDKYKEEDAK